MIIQIDRNSGEVLSFDYLNPLEDIQRFTPSYIEVVEITKTYLDSLTKAQVRKMADKGNIDYPEGASKSVIVDAILNFKQEA